MARPRNPIPSTRVELQIPEDIVLQVDLLLPKAFDGTLKLGARSRLVSRLLRRWLDEVAQNPSTTTTL